MRSTFPFLTLLLLAALCPAARAQRVTIIEEPAITRMLERHIAENMDPARRIEGWRIQIAATVDRRQVDQTRTACQRQFPGLPVISTYDEPYYKLRIGAYSLKQVAEKALRQIKREYPGAYLVRDKVRFAELSD